MKKLNLLLSLILLTFYSQSQTPAPDFTAVDCNSVSHNLYSEVNSGKVILLCWVMPCATCISASVTGYNIVQGFANKNVLFYLIDDIANTSCATLSSWATTNSIGAIRQTFSTTSITESNYGGVGMPHLVVVGRNGKYYFNELNAAANNATAITTAINSALAAASVSNISKPIFQLNISPSPAIQSTVVSYSLKESAEVNIEIINETGQLIETKSLGKQDIGENKLDLDISNYANGIYFVRCISGNYVQSIKFSVAH